MRIASPFGIPLYAHYSFLLFVVFLFGLSCASAGFSQAIQGMLFLLGAFFFVTVHEYGHCLIARRFGYQTEAITLYPMGGLAGIHITRTTPKRLAAVAAAGPLCNLVLGALFGLLHWCGVAPYLTMPCTQINLALLAFNILPFYPMDGGQLLFCLFWRVYKNVWKAKLIATRIGQIGAGTLALILIFNGIIILGFVLAFIVYLGQVELSSYRQILFRRACRVKELQQVVEGQLGKPGLFDADPDRCRQMLKDVPQELLHQVSASKEFAELEELMSSKEDGDII